MRNDLRDVMERWHNSDGFAASRLEECHDLLYTLAAAYMADHPADDAEPVTEEWLKAVLGEKMTYDMGFDFRVRFYVYSQPEIEYETGRGYEHCESSVDLPEAKTRGDVRRICAALGVPLASHVS